jgi:hypothetical protein
MINDESMNYLHLNNWFVICRRVFIWRFLAKCMSNTASNGRMIIMDGSGNCGRTYRTISAFAWMDWVKPPRGFCRDKKTPTVLDEWLEHSLRVMKIPGSILSSEAGYNNGNLNSCRQILRQYFEIGHDIPIKHSSRYIFAAIIPPDIK